MDSKEDGKDSDTCRCGINGSLARSVDLVEDPEIRVEGYVFIENKDVAGSEADKRQRD